MRSWGALAAVLAVVLMAQGASAVAVFTAVAASTVYDYQPPVLKALGDNMANVPMTSASYAKIWTMCDVNTAATSTISYVLDSAPSVTLGTAITDATPVYVLLNGLEDGTHKLVFTCTDNSDSQTATQTYTWVVDSEDKLKVQFTDKPSTPLTRHTSKSFSFKASKAMASQVASISWMCSMRKEGKSDSFSSCGCDNSQTCTYAAPLSAGDGDYTLKVYAAYTYTVYSGSATQYYPADLGDGKSNTVTSNTVEYDIELDSAPPTIKVTSAPPAKQAYTSGMTVQFAFECDDKHMPCTFQCALDGKNSSKGGKGSRGWFTCSSPVTLTPTHTTTHAFAFRGIDAVGNVSPMSDLHTFYTDGTAPKAILRHAAKSDDTVLTVCEKGADSCRTVLQLDSYDAEADSWDVKDGYEGAVVATRVVNGAKTNFVVDSTSASSGRIGYKCLHPEFGDTSDLPYGYSK